MKANRNNWRIEIRNGFYVPVCRSPRGSRVLKIMHTLKSKDLHDVELMMKGMFKSLEKI